MLEDEEGGKFNEAGVHLRTAAGIFERLYKVGSHGIQMLFRACLGEIEKAAEDVSPKIRSQVMKGQHGREAFPPTSKGKKHLS